MALTITDGGSALGTTSASTLAITGNTGAIGDMMVVVIAAANSGTNGVSSIASVTDAQGNVYTQRMLNNWTPGAVAGDGATDAIYTSVLTTALAAETITVNFSPNVAQKAACVYRVQPGAGEVPTFVANGEGTAASSNAPTVTTASITSGHTVFGAAAIETNDAITADSDTSNGNWSAIRTFLADGGADASAMTSCSQWKTVTGTATQTYNLSWTTARDTAIGWISIYAAVAGIIEADANAAGAATATGISAAIWLSTASSAGIAAATGDAAALSAAEAAAAGVATGTADAASVFASVASSAGIADATGIAASVFAAVASSTGSSTAQADAEDAGTGSVAIAAGGYGASRSYRRRIIWDDGHIKEARSPAEYQRLIGQLIAKMDAKEPETEPASVAPPKSRLTKAERKEIVFEFAAFPQIDYSGLLEAVETMRMAKSMRQEEELMIMIAAAL